MFSYEIGTSVVPFSYSGAPAAPTVFAIAKQAFKRGAVYAGAQTLAFAGKHKFNVAIWGVLASTIVGIAGYNTITAPNTARNLAGIEAEIDKEAARIHTSIAQRNARYEQVVRGFEPSFDLAAWNAKQAARQPLQIDVSLAPLVVAPDVQQSSVIPAQPIIDAAHVKNLLGEHPLVARFATAQKTCPAVAANMQMDGVCKDMMNPLYRQLADVVVARTAQNAKQVATQVVQKTHVLSSTKGGDARTVQRVSAPATKLLKIQQPKQEATNRPVRHAEGKTKKKAVANATRPDYATEFWRSFELNKG